MANLANWPNLAAKLGKLDTFAKYASSVWISENSIVFFNDEQIKKIKKWREWLFRALEMKDFSIDPVSVRKSRNWDLRLNLGISFCFINQFVGPFFENSKFMHLIKLVCTFLFLGLLPVFEWNWLGSFCQTLISTVISHSIDPFQFQQVLYFPETIQPMLPEWMSSSPVAAVVIQNQIWKACFMNYCQLKGQLMIHTNTGNCLIGGNVSMSSRKNACLFLFFLFLTLLLWCIYFCLLLFLSFEFLLRVVLQGPKLGSAYTTTIGSHHNAWVLVSKLT